MIGAVGDAGDVGRKPGKGPYEEGGYLSAKHWRLDVAYRHQFSHRHFVGTTEQVQREQQESEVLNHINLQNYLVTYQANARWSFQFNLPVMIANRYGESNPGRRYDSNGIGDVSLTAQTWLWRPPTESGGNIAVGFGVKFPTGNAAVSNTFRQGLPVQNVDQSIQLGDDAYGIIGNFQAFKTVHRAVLFADGSYVMEPNGGPKGVKTYRGNPLEAIMSASDSYLADAGIAHPFPKLRGVAVNFGGRVEGIPIHNLVGSSLGFRRPGYAFSVVPGFEYSKGRNLWTFNLPIAVVRDRSRSVPDRMDGGHGDAAFADVIWLLTYSRKF